ncbi:helix-turn-helix domain-containing protein [Oceanobacillus chungangensis]|uniref:helix-turn-helix domain-containing protein n=1 Tax=Oceanobacillus chungangensis TaxID=1229152 RepID=UPI001475A6F5|nr:helix-turn-helix domain-containing protein [Oceanobacillus chungangensis]
MSLAWSAEEVEYLKDCAGNTKISTIANNLGRSSEGVTIKMKRLNINHTKKQMGMVTIHELAAILGVDRKTVEGWVIRHRLPCKMRVTKEKRTFYLIDAEEFWKWAENHKDKVQFSDIETHVLNPEPGWVNQERRKEREQSLSKKRKYQMWTTKEDEQLIRLRESGLTYRKIGEAMNRSAISVERRYKRVKG